MTSRCRSRRPGASSLPAIQRANAALARCLLDVTGKQVIVDSSKMGLRLKYLLRNPDFDVRVIRIVRDGRAVALAYMDPAGFADASDPRLRQGGMGGDRANERQTMPEAAHQWRRSNEEAESLLAEPAALPLDRGPLRGRLSGHRGTLAAPVRVRGRRSRPWRGAPAFVRASRHRQRHAAGHHHGGPCWTSGGGASSSPATCRCSRPRRARWPVAWVISELRRADDGRGRRRFSSRGGHRRPARPSVPVSRHPRDLQRPRRDARIVTSTRKRPLPEHHRGHCDGPRRGAGGGEHHLLRHAARPVRVLEHGRRGPGDRPGPHPLGACGLLPFVR